MFEKEAKEYIKKNNLDWELECNRTSPIGEVNQAFQQGAEFGYNKANEWHYVKDGDLPKDDKSVLVLLKDKTTQVDYYFPKIGWNISVNADVIAWQEIVLPELKDC